MSVNDLLFIEINYKYNNQNKKRIKDFICLTNCLPNTGQLVCTHLHSDHDNLYNIDQN